MLELMSPIALLCLCSPLMGGICSMLLGRDMNNRGVYIITIMGKHCMGAIADHG